MDSSKISTGEQSDRPQAATGSQSATSRRVPQLDFLRGIAILLVISCHPLVGTPQASPWEAIVFYPFAYTGWSGVDLFFVLSGFLISGLIFSEFKKTGGFQPLRFLIRRAFKIWPGYYVFLALTLPLLASVHVSMKYPNLLGELLFLQNYIQPTFWPHTWSLAVEEQFYFCLALILYLAVGRFKSIKYIPYACLTIMVVALIGRFLRAQTGEFETLQSHLRADALAFGVLLGYLHSFFPERLGALVRPKKTLLFALLLIATGLAFHPKIYWFGYVFGLTLAYLGYGLVLVHLVYSSWKENAVLRTVSVIGVYSYSMYIWLPAVSYIVEIYRILLEHW